LFKNHLPNQTAIFMRTETVYVLLFYVLNFKYNV
jgi:hypothetical protein